MRALDGVDLTIRGGERVAIVGQNGSGKTTLVRHFNGLLRPQEGTVVVGDLDTSVTRVAHLAARVGLAFQDPDRQIFAGNVEGEVSFGAKNLGLRGSELAEAVKSALDSVGLSAERKTNPYDLGYSRRKLLTIASVLAMRTPIVVLDEPTTGQDARGVRTVKSIVDSVAAEGRTVIAVSHDLRFVAESFARVVVMRQGRVILDGRPDEVFAADELGRPGVRRTSSRRMRRPLASDSASAPHRPSRRSWPRSVQFANEDRTASRRARHRAAARADAGRELRQLRPNRQPHLRVREHVPRTADGEIPKGKVGVDVSTAEAAEHARLTGHQHPGDPQGRAGRSRPRSSHREAAGHGQLHARLPGAVVRHQWLLGPVRPGLRRRARPVGSRHGQPAIRDHRRDRGDRRSRLVAAAYCRVCLVAYLLTPVMDPTRNCCCICS